MLKCKHYSEFDYCLVNIYALINTSFEMSRIAKKKNAIYKGCKIFLL